VDVYPPQVFPSDTHHLGTGDQRTMSPHSSHDGCVLTPQVGAASSKQTTVVPQALVESYTRDSGRSGAILPSLVAFFTFDDRVPTPLPTPMSGDVVFTSRLHGHCIRIGSGSPWKAWTCSDLDGVD